MKIARPGSLRVVLDTNVYFSAFAHVRSAAPLQLWQSALERRYTLLTSPAILRELAGVLRRQAQWSEANVLQHLKLLARLEQIVTSQRALEVITEDPDDDRLLECAVEGRADLIVSGDRHLTRLKSFHGVGIVRPVDFLRILSS